MNKLNKAIGSLVGLAVGDAIGTTVEFKTRDTYPVLTDMVGGGVFNLEPGQWTDDTSMALCLGNSLLKNGFDIDSQLSEYFQWYSTGKYSSNGKCFDIGNTTANALIQWDENFNTVNNDSVECSGNGSMMRLAPLIIYSRTEEAYTQEYVDFLQDIRESSEATHAYVTAVDACVGLGVILNRILYYPARESILDFVNTEPGMFGITDPEIIKVLQGSYITKKRSDISSSGYCVHTLEAALWCFYHTDSFKDAVLLAANLGDDADTVAAVTGQIAGAFYGLDGIPVEWVNRITMSTEIQALAHDLFYS